MPARRVSSSPGISSKAKPMFQDMVDPGEITVVNSFEDMCHWPITKGIRRVEMLPGRGIVVHATDTAGWPDYHLDNDPAAGLCRFTLCAGFMVNGRWHMSGFFEYWAHGTHEGHLRTDSGAHPLEQAPDGRNQWQANWAYPNRGWAPLDAFLPTPGVEMLIMLTAGDSRMRKTLTKRERTQIVKMTLKGFDARDFAPVDVPAPGPSPDPALPEPTHPQAEPPRLEAMIQDLLNRLGNMEEADRRQQQQIDEMKAQPGGGAPTVAWRGRATRFGTKLADVIVDSPMNAAQFEAFKKGQP